MKPNPNPLALLDLKEKRMVQFLGVRIGVIWRGPQERKGAVTLRRTQQPESNPR